MNRKPIFCRTLDLNTGKPDTMAPPYLSGISNWPNGGTVYRGQWELGDDAYDRNGAPRKIVIERKLENLKTESVVAIDIEANGYNGPAWKAGRNQIQFVPLCRNARPDCKFGYYGSVGHVDNALMYPQGRRAEYEAVHAGSQRLIGHLDFLSPSIYTTYVGTIKDRIGNPTPGMAESFHKKWPTPSNYGFREWASYAKWIIDLCRKYDKPVYPFYAPYTVQNGPTGEYKVGYLRYPCPFFADAVEFIMKHADGMFFFDRYDARYAPPVEQEIVKVISKYLV